MFNVIKRFLIGETLSNDQLSEQKYSVFWGLPILSSDAVSSVAYAGEEILWVLVPVLGLMSYRYMFYAALAIVFLLLILQFSYRQTIDSYPNGGGSYIVARDNLGIIPSLVACAALSIDYVLTVAVSTSAGTAALTSAMPVLYPYRVIITLAIIVLLMIGNLRGIKDSSRIFSIPTYLFLLTMTIMIITGILKVHLFGYTPHAIVEVPKVTGSITTFLFLRAFASGCTALTGVEAVSDGIPNFKEPSQKNAKRVLALLVLIVFIIFGGTSYLSTLYHAVPTADKTVVSQIAIQVFGNGFMFYAIQITTAIILVMAANTAFADLPLLLSFVSRDGFAPRQFSKRGERLNYSNGIVLVSIAAGALIIIFNGETHLLMPLYAVGVFLSFTISQSGMVRHWVKSKCRGWKHRAIINGLGASITFFTVILIGITKFKAGAWIVCILIPMLVFCMLKIKVHYNRVADELRLTTKDDLTKLGPRDGTIQHVVVPIDTLNKSSLKALYYAKRLSKNVIAFHVSIDEAQGNKLRQKWREFDIDIPLVIKYSPYREIVSPLLKYINSAEHASRPNDIVTIIMPQFVVTSWWQNILHNQTALIIKRSLLKDKKIAVVTVPYIIR